MGNFEEIILAELLPGKQINTGFLNLSSDLVFHPITIGYAILAGLKIINCRPPGVTTWSMLKIRTQKNKIKMEERPKIKLELTTADKTLELIGWLSVIAIWWLTITNYAALPGTIPTHYNGAGRADGFGGKTTILILPLIATILFMGMTILNQFPRMFNYPVNITKDNALRQYSNATRMIRYLKLIIVIIFGLIVFKTIQNAKGQATGLGIWFLPLTLGLIFIPLTYFIVKSFKINQ